MLGHHGAVAVRYGHLGGMEPHDHLLAGVLGGGRVPMPAVDPDLALLVGDGAPVGDAGERMPRQRQEGVGVLVEQDVLALSLPPVLLALGERHAPLKQAGVVAVHAPYPGDRHEQGAPEGAHLVLHGPLLMPRPGVAETVFEAVVGGERLEERGQAYRVGDPPAGARGVVEHDRGGHAADELEDVLHPLADALAVLPGHHLHQPDIGVGEAHHEVRQLHAGAPHDEIGEPEVHLGLACRPFEVEVLLRALMHPLLREVHVAPHRGFRHVGAELLGEPLPYAMGGVALLPVLAHVVLEPLVDVGRPPVHLARALFLLHRHLRRQVLHPGVLVHRIPGHLQVAGYRRHALPPPVPLAYRIDLVHADHFPSGPPLPYSGQQQR